MPIQKALSLNSIDNEKSLQEDEVKALIRALVESEDPQPTSNTPTTSNGASYTHTTTTRSDQDKAKPHTKKEVEARSLLKQQEDNLGDSRCSIGTLKLHCLRVLATKEVYLMVYFLLGLLQGMIYTYGVSLISTIEKVFSLTSREAGVILAGHGLTLALMCVLLPPCGTHVHRPHRPRWMGVGVVTSLTCCLVAVVTHFASVSASVRLQPTKKVRTEVCFSEGSQDGSCQNATGVGEVFVNPVILLFISQFLVGIALSIFYTVGVTYLDDNINKKASPLNYATPLLLKMLVRMVGPVCGFLLGGWCLSLWVVPSPHTNTNDPTRHGPWWIGYLLLACGLLVSCGFLYLCPGKLAGEAVKRKEVRQEEAAKKQWWLDEFLVCNRKRKEARRYVHNLPKALKRLFGSKIWVGNLFSSVTFFLAIACYFNFKSKYLETHFGKSASEANFYTGLSTLGASLLAVAATAAFMRWTRPSSRFLASYDVILTLLGCVSYVILMFLSCPQLHILGPLARSEAGECSSECKCSLQFSPVCAEDNTTVFYSACYAGCSAFDLSSESLVYRACRCIGNFSNPFITVPDTLHTVPDTLHTVPGTLHTVSDTFHTVPDTLHTVPDLQRTWGSATPGYCPDTCQVFLWYILVQMLTTTICASGRITNAVVQLRAVPEEDRELSLGILGVCISLFGILPAPIIMGTALDSACLVWENQCGHPGHCNFYDSDKLRIIMHLVPAVFAFASALGDLVVLYYSRKMNLYDDKDNDDYEVPRNDKLA
ncbi:hypothetical protein OTU49_006597 [Cherax quadricarinatus]|uniref:Kazal-like domain-containing protein n=3 Tax=Cherax quadricarinatus TaxID=27406 RepID=A0AAW0WMG4_CHEQU